MDDEPPNQHVWSKYGKVILFVTDVQSNVLISMWKVYGTNLSKWYKIDLHTILLFVITWDDLVISIPVTKYFFPFLENIACPLICTDVMILYHINSDFSFHLLWLNLQFVF